MVRLNRNQRYNSSEYAAIVEGARYRTIAIVPTIKKLYWLQWTEAGDKIQRANLDGTGREDVLTGLGDGADLAIDGRDRKLYWSETDAGKIRRANLDGTGTEDVLVELPAPTGVALDMLHDDYRRDEP